MKLLIFTKKNSFFLCCSFCGVIEAMINQTRQQTKYCMGFSSHGSKKGNHNHNHNHNYNNNYMNEDDDASIEKMRKEIEANQDSALSLCTEKVLLARQAYELVSFFFLPFGWCLFIAFIYDLDKRVSYIVAFIRKVCVNYCCSGTP
jgi:hypothetical protein